MGQSTDALSGDEDASVVREARQFWLQETSDGYANMRAKLDHDLAAVAEEAPHMDMSMRTIYDRLVTPYPKRKDVDDVLEKLGEDFFQDAIHNDDDLNGEEDVGDEGEGGAHAAVADEESSDVEDGGGADGAPSH